MLDTSRGILPLPVTRDVQDSYAATSPQSLTLIQLLSGVDMAGAILPPETLSKMVVLHCELVPELFASPSQRAVVEYVQKSLPKNQPSFVEAHPWIQSRVKLPQVTLDQLELIYDVNHDDWICKFQCALKGDDRFQDTITMDVTPDILIPVTYQYEKDDSDGNNDLAPTMFMSLCLALRYKAPIVIRNLGHVSTIPDDLDTDFPQRTTVQKLQSTSTRVVQNIERGFEIHTLTNALKIAMEKGDTVAAERIRTKLDEYDSLDDLPTIEEKKNSETDSEDSQDGGGIIDDLDKNILQ